MIRTITTKETIITPDTLFKIVCEKLGIQPTQATWKMNQEHLIISEILEIGENHV